MQNDEEVSRRIFLERLAAGALLGAAGAGSQSALASSNSAAWTPPPALKNPNILIIMVDQMRAPTWLSSSQMAALSSSVLPNIMGRIQNNAYSFDEFFVAATVCTTSRSCLLTGLYAPQTAMYSNADVGTSAPALNPAFPTWGQAVAALNPAQCASRLRPDRADSIGLQGAIAVQVNGNGVGDDDAGSNLIGAQDLKSRCVGGQRLEFQIVGGHA